MSELGKKLIAAIKEAIEVEKNSKKINEVNKNEQVHRFLQTDIYDKTIGTSTIN